jgi:hypothetical protein
MMHEDGTQNAQSRRPEEPQHTPRQHAPRWVAHAKNEGGIETPGDQTKVDPPPISPPAK